MKTLHTIRRFSGFLLLLPSFLFLHACSKGDIEGPDADDMPWGTDSTITGGGDGDSYFVHFTADGIGYSLAYEVNGFNTLNSGEGPIGTDISCHYYGSGFYWSAVLGGTPSELFFDLTTSSICFPQVDGSASVFHDHFTLGEKTYYVMGTGEDHDGFSIDYIDPDGILWESEMGDQTGSTLEITWEQDHGIVYGDPSHEIKGTFNCKVYDEAGNVLELTDGGFYLEYRDVF